MGAAWEWRAFRPPVTGQSLDHQVDALQAAIASTQAPQEWEEQDSYLVLRGQPHNFKLRAGCLEVKWLMARSPGGYGLWQDKEVWSFPLGPLAQKRLDQLDPRRRSPPPMQSPADLLAWLEGMADSTRVTVGKRRVRLVGEAVRVEVAEVTGLAAAPLLSICVDGYQLAPVRSMVERLKLDTWGRALSYVDLLTELLWWLPVLMEGEVAVGRVAESQPTGLEFLQGRPAGVRWWQRQHPPVAGGGGPTVGKPG